MQRRKHRETDCDRPFNRSTRRTVAADDVEEAAKDALADATMDAVNEHATLPLAPAVPSQAKGTTKRARFKVRPKGGGKRKPAKK